MFKLTRIFVIITFIFSTGLTAFAQNGSVVIGDESIGDYSETSILYLNTISKGFLAPRVALVDQNTPIADGVVAKQPGLLVWNTNAGSYVIGFHYWDGLDWKPLLSSITGSGTQYQVAYWNSANSLTGNDNFLYEIGRAHV